MLTTTNPRHRRTRRVRRFKVAACTALAVAMIASQANAESVPAYDALPALEYQTDSTCRILDAYPLSDDGSGVAVCAGSTDLWGYDHATRAWSPFTHCYALGEDSYSVVHGTLTCAYIMGYGAEYVAAIVDTSDPGA
jgi:hypothetical protein